MRSPFLVVALGFALGISAGQYVAAPILYLETGVIAGIVCLWFFRRSGIFLPMFMGVMGCAGMLWIHLADRVPGDAVQRFSGPGRVVLTGVVQSLPETKIRGKRERVSFVLSAKSFTTREEKKLRRLHVQGDVQVNLLQSRVIPQVGDHLRLFGVLSVPKPALNPGEFDYKAFLAQQNIHAVFQTIGPRSVRTVRVGSKFLPSRLLAGCRRALADLIDRCYVPNDAAILKALVLGLRSDIAAEVRDQFMKTGTIHLLAISGLNITMIAGTFFLIFLFAGLDRRWTAGLTILVVIIYVGLAGAGIPVQRAGFGSVLVLFGMLIGRPSSLLNALSAAFFFILLGNPHSLWNIGFQLSFLSVFSLILVLPLLTRVNIGALTLASSFAVLLGTFPVVLYHFNVFSPVSVLANLVAIPLFDAVLFSGLVVLGCHAVPVLAPVTTGISSGMLHAGLLWIHGLSTWRGGYWFVARPSPGVLAAYYLTAGMILWSHKRVFPWKKYCLGGAVAGWMICAVLCFFHPVQRRFELTLFASGRNQIAHAGFSNGAQWLFNVGRNFPSDQGEWLLNPFLRSCGLQRLDGILFSDISKQHTGGVRSVLRDFSVRYLFYPANVPGAFEEFHAMSKKRCLKIKALQPGNSVLLGTERFRVVAESRKGMAFVTESGPWRVLFISRWDPEIFAMLLESSTDLNEIHAVFLPVERREVPVEAYQWLERLRPLLVVLPGSSPRLMSFLDFQHIPYLELTRTGALNFRRVEDRLELWSFLKGRVGIYAYT